MISLCKNAFVLLYTNMFLLVAICASMAPPLCCSKILHPFVKGQGTIREYDPGIIHKGPNIVSSFSLGCKTYVAGEGVETHVHLLKYYVDDDTCSNYHNLSHFQSPLLEREGVRR